MLSISVTLAVLFFVILGALFGFVKGFKKSVLRLITVVIAAILAYFVSVPITGLFVTKNNVYSLIEMFGATETYNELIAASPAAEELVCALLASVIATIVFILLFFIIKLLTLIPYAILSKKLSIFKNEDGEIEKETAKTKLIGLPIGAVQGLVSVMVIVFVLTGFFSVADNVLNTILNDKSGNLSELQDSLEPIHSVMEDIKKDPVVGLLCYDSPSDNDQTVKESCSNTSLSISAKKYGKNNFVFEGLTKIKFRGKKLSLTNESVIITRTFVHAMPLLDESDSGFSETQIETLDGLVGAFSESEILTEVGAELIAGACEKWSQGEEFLGVGFNGVSEDIDPILMAIFGSMKDSTAETLGEDLHSVVEVLLIFNDYNLLDKFNADSLIKNLNGDFISELLTTLSANERFNVVIPEVTNLSIKMIAKTLNIADVSDLLLEPGHYNLSEEDIQNLSEGFDHIFTFIDSIESLEGDISFDKINAIDITSMGLALDSFKKTTLLGNAVDPIAGAVVSGVTGSSAENITDALEEGDVSYESLMDTVQSTANVINNMQKEDATVEEKQQAIVDLFENITPENAEVIVAAVDKDFVVQMGADPNYAEPFAEVISVSLKEMATLDEAEHEAEAEKVKYIFDIVANSDKNAYGEDGVFESVEDIITVAMDSKVAGTVLMELAYDDNGNEVSDALGIATSISDEDREHIAQELMSYYEDKKATESPEELERINQMTQAVSLLILGMK